MTSLVYPQVTDRGRPEHTIYTPFIPSFDIEAGERAGTAGYVETLDTVIAEDIVSRVISVIDPAG